MSRVGVEGYMRSGVWGRLLGMGVAKFSRVLRLKSEVRTPRPCLFADARTPATSAPAMENATPMPRPRD
jgi:hypothetical protein